MQDNLDPVLLFEVVQNNNKYGVYFVPQQGVGMQGMVFDGSTISVARKIATMGNVKLIPKAINPKDTTQDNIVHSVNEWMHSWDNGTETIVSNVVDVNDFEE